MEAGLQDRGMRIQGGRREETGNSSQGDQAAGTRSLVWEAFWGERDV